ncbi:MAG: HIT domain-containing protein [Candidatus Micrarchaeaceae archaeon]
MARNCVFCRIIEKKEKAYIVYEDKNVLAVLDKNPFTEGHTVIMTKKHYESLFDVDKKDLLHVILLAKKLALLYKKEFKCDGANIIHASGAIAGQSVNHFHVHLVPRYKADNLGNLWYRARNKCINNYLVYGRLVTSKYYKLLGESNMAKANL